MTARDPRPGPPQPGTPWPDPQPYPGGPTGPRQRTPLPVVALWLLAPSLIVFGGWAGGIALTWWAS